MSVRFTVRLNVLKGFFQPKRFSDSMILILGIVHYLCTALHALQLYLAGRAVLTAPRSVPQCTEGAVGRGFGLLEVGVAGEERASIPARSGLRS